MESDDDNEQVYGGFFRSRSFIVFRFHLTGNTKDEHGDATKNSKQTIVYIFKNEEPVIPGENVPWRHPTYESPFPNPFSRDIPFSTLQDFPRRLIDSLDLIKDENTGEFWERMWKISSGVSEIRSARHIPFQ